MKQSNLTLVETETAFFHLSGISHQRTHVFCSGLYWLYSDTMSKIGVLGHGLIKSGEFYDCLKIGPSMSCRIFLLPCALWLGFLLIPKSQDFSPIYVLATTLDGNIVGVQTT